MSLTEARNTRRPPLRLPLQSPEKIAHRFPYEKLSARNRLGVHEVFLRAEPFEQRLPFAEVRLAHVFRREGRLPDVFVGPVQNQSRCCRDAYRHTRGLSNNSLFDLLRAHSGRIARSGWYRKRGDITCHSSTFKPSHRLSPASADLSLVTRHMSLRHRRLTPTTFPQNEDGFHQ